MNNRIILILILLLSLNFSQGQNISKFGDQKITTDGAITGSELIKILSKQDSAQVKLIAKITGVCQKKGCWMEADLGDGTSILIRFLDYGFFVPINSTGKTCIVEGVAKIETLSVQWLKHQLEDANATQEEIDAITEPEISYSISEATGVIIKE